MTRKSDKYVIQRLYILVKHRKTICNKKGSKYTSSSKWRTLVFSCH